MKSEAEIREEIALLITLKEDAVGQQMRDDGQWDQINKLRELHPDIDTAIGALIEYVGLEERIRALVNVEQHNSYRPSTLASTSYERYFHRSLADRIEKGSTG